MCNLKSIYKLNLLLLLICFIFSCRSNSGANEDVSVKPEENRFTESVLEASLDEPIMFQIIDEKRILIAERKGKIKVFDQSNHRLDVIADIPVSTGYYSKTGKELSSKGEDGMLGAILGPNFKKDHWVYLYYSPKGGVPRSVLARFEWTGSGLDTNSKKILLEVPNQRESCCHLGGGMLFDSVGNLFLTTGDNTPNDARGYSPLDERQERDLFDSQRSSANSNDLRGKILRIHPEPDGTYSIPAGNLFARGLPKTRPEIYTMGNRNPWRLSMDTKTGWLYWGEVGPGGTKDSVGMGPKSFDEFNQARKPGNFGWPQFSGNNQAYWRYDYALQKPLEKFDTLHPVNLSPHNTGLTDLPPAQPAFIWYPQCKSDEFQLLGSGSNCAVGGPVYHLADFKTSKHPFPAYYEGKWLITDWVRGWIMAVSMREDGSFKSMEQFLPNLKLNGPIDMKFGPDGDLYILEYGRSPYEFSPEARLVKIGYNKGNRTPVVNASADKTAGAVPLLVHLSSKGTIDYDKDKLVYEWKITSDGRSPRLFSDVNPVVTFSEPGRYRATLIVHDSKGAADSSSVEIIGGNDPPNVKINFNGANKSFFFLGDTVNYSVDVSDKEDGSLANRQIDPSHVSVSAGYLNPDADANFRNIKDSLTKIDALTPIRSVMADQLISQSDCHSCHRVENKLIGPAFNDVAKKYEKQAGAEDYLVNKIITGGHGVWGEMNMPAHPSITENAARLIANYILDLNKSRQKPIQSLSVKGNYLLDIPKEDKNRNFSHFGLSYTDKFIFRASYTDRGTKLAPPQSSVNIITLRNPIVPVFQANKFEGLDWTQSINPNLARVNPKKSGSYLELDQIDLSGIGRIEFDVAGVSKTDSALDWVVKVKIDSATGTVIGTTSDSLVIEKKPGSGRPMLKADLIPIAGVHDLYFVFEKKNGTGDQMKLGAIRFIRK